MRLKPSGFGARVLRAPSANFEFESEALHRVLGPRILRSKSKCPREYLRNPFLWRADRRLTGSCVHAAGKRTHAGNAVFFALFARIEKSIELFSGLMAAVTGSAFLSRRNEEHPLAV